VIAALHQALCACVLAIACGSCVAFHAGAMPGEPSNARFATIEGTRVRYTVTGSGPTVTLLHGFASSLETWDGVTPELSRDHRVVALDLKGFGWTDRPPGDYSPSAQAALVFALLDSLGVTRTSVVAHSWGSSVALAMARLAPDRVSRVALYDAWVYEEQLPTFFQLARSPGVGETLFSLWYDERPDERLEHAFFDRRAIPEALIEAVEAALRRPGTKAAALAAVRGQDFAAVQHDYRSIRVPTLLLWGREDEVARLSFGERLSRELPQSKLIVYPRCGHFPMIEAAAASTRDLAAFLRDGAR